VKKKDEFERSKKKWGLPSLKQTSNRLSIDFPRLRYLCDPTVCHFQFFPYASDLAVSRLYPETYLFASPYCVKSNSMERDIKSCHPFQDPSAS
jgi:hypothetical protein